MLHLKSPSIATCMPHWLHCIKAFNTQLHIRTQYNTIFWGKKGQLGQGTSVTGKSRIDYQTRGDHEWPDCITD